MLDLGFVGSVKSIDTTVLDLLADEMIPVVASVGADDDGQVFNINAERWPASSPPPRTPRRSSF